MLTVQLTVVFQRSPSMADVQHLNSISPVWVGRAKKA